MKKLILFILSLVYTTCCFAQNNSRPDPISDPQFLGFWNTITITQSHIVGNKAYYIIGMPPEGISSEMPPVGPGSPRFGNSYGTTLQLVFNLPILLSDMETYSSADEALIEIPVKKWIKNDGSYTTDRSESNIRSTCYYCSIIHLDL